jgi:hypothetical protein
VLVHALDVGDHHAQRRVGLEGRDLAGDLLGAPLVVVVEEREERAGGRRHPEVAGRRHPAIGLAQVADAVAEGAAEHRLGVVGAAVVDHDDLEAIGWVGLGHRRGHRDPDVGRAVEGRDDRGDPRRSHVALLLAPRDRSTR